MSYSQLFGIKKNFTGEETHEFDNSWFFSPIVWEILSDKYIPEMLQTQWGTKRSMILDIKLWETCNERLNNSADTADRVCWELCGQQIFFTKDKEIVSSSIKKFAEQNRDYDKMDDGTYPLKKEHIFDRFNEISKAILELDEAEYPFFVFKGTSCDDNVSSWFCKFDEDKDEFVDKSLSEITSPVTEFVFIKDGKIDNFVSNIVFFNIKNMIQEIGLEE